MNIKKHLVILCFLGSCFGAFSQNYSGNSVIDPKEVQSLKSTTLLVVVDSDQSALGKALISSFNKYWKFTKFKFIKSSDMDKNLSNGNVSIFDFVLLGGFQKGHEFVQYKQSDVDGFFDFGGGSKQLFIYLDKSVPPGKVYYKNRTIASSAKCSFAIFRGGPDIKQVDQGLYSGVSFVDYVTPTQPETGVYDEKGMWHKHTQFDLYESLNSDEQLTIPYISFYIERLEQHLEYIYQHGAAPKTSKETEKISWEYKGGANDDVAKITSYDDGLQQIKTMKILVDSAITDAVGKKILAKTLGISEDAIQLVPWSTIEDAINNKTPGIAILYQPRLDYTADFGYVFWTSDGKRLIDWYFRHIGTNSTYCFGFRKDDNFDCDRTAIHFK
jgi:hypothetical protein